MSKLAAVLACLLCVPTVSPAMVSTTRPDLVNVSGNLPLAFEPNRGQTDRAVDYVARGNGYSVFLKSSETVLALRGADGMNPEFLRLTFKGGKTNATPAAAATLPGRSNYVRGRNPESWLQDIPQFARVQYRQIYPGVDVVYYGNHGKLEYDFLLHSGADANRIAITIDGARKLTIDETGDLHVAMTNGEVIQKRPFAYQLINNKPVQVAVHYRIVNRNAIGFRIASYDRTRPLMIDPVLVYSTYLGGAGIDIGRAVAMDSQGNTYVAGSTESTGFPAINAVQGMKSGGFDAFVSKINNDGSALLFSTFLGGDNTDDAFGAAVDASGNVYVTGSTNSENFPVLNALQDHIAGPLPPDVPIPFSDVFVAKLTSAGTLVYSTYLGGSSFDAATAIAVDVLNNAYVTGFTNSHDFPGSVPATTSLTSAFVVKLNASGNAVLNSKLLNGNGLSFSNDIKVDVLGGAYITGMTTAPDFPTTPGAEKTIGDTLGDVFVSKIDFEGPVLAWSTFLGGSGIDTSPHLAIDSTGNVYVTGQTLSGDFPIRGPAFQTNNQTAGGYDGFLSIFSQSGSLGYSSYFGGTKSDWPRGIGLDAAGNIHIAGATQSGDFPIVDATQPDIGDASLGDGFVIKFNPAATQALFATFMGGQFADGIESLAVSPGGTISLTGWTNSTTFPVKDALQPDLAGLFDAFVAKISQPNAAREADQLLLSLRTGHVHLYSMAGTLLKDIVGDSDGAAKGMAFDRAGNLYVAHWTGSAIGKGNFVEVFSPDFLTHHTFGSNYDCNPTSLAFDSNGNLYVGQVDCTGDVLKFNSSGAFLGSFNVAVENHGSAWIDVQADNCTLLYGSEGPNVKRFDVCNGLQLPDLNPIPLPESAPVHQVRILPDGSVLAAAGDRLIRFGPAGDIVREFTIPGEDCFRGIAMHPSRTSFFATNYCNSHVYRVDLVSGVVLQSFTAATPPFTVKGPHVPPPPPPSDEPEKPSRCRFTGGGNFVGLTGTKVTHGFEIHCDPTELPNNIQFNWDRGNHFHLTSLLTATCTASCDTITGTGVGRYNGVDGATLSFMFSDAGEPGVNDGIEVRITDAGGNVVMVAETTLKDGNHQAHGVK